MGSGEGASAPSNVTSSEEIVVLNSNHTSSFNNHFYSNTPLSNGVHFEVKNSNSSTTAGFLRKCFYRLFCGRFKSHKITTIIDHNRQCKLDDQNNKHKKSTQLDVYESNKKRNNVADTLSSSNIESEISAEINGPIRNFSKSEIEYKVTPWDNELSLESQTLECSFDEESVPSLTSDRTDFEYKLNQYNNSIEKANEQVIDFKSRQPPNLRLKEINLYSDKNSTVKAFSPEDINDINNDPICDEVVNLEIHETSLVETVKNKKQEMSKQDLYPIDNIESNKSNVSNSISLNLSDLLENCLHKNNNTIDQAISNIPDLSDQDCANSMHQDISNRKDLEECKISISSYDSNQYRTMNEICVNKNSYINRLSNERKLSHTDKDEKDIECKHKYSCYSNVDVSSNGLCVNRASSPVQDKHKHSEVNTLSVISSLSRKHHRHPHRRRHGRIEDHHKLYKSIYSSLQSNGNYKFGNNKWDSDLGNLSHSHWKSSSTPHLHMDYFDYNNDGGNIKTSSSLCQLNSGSSDEGCHSDISPVPSNPILPFFVSNHKSHYRHHNVGLYTPFRALSPASSSLASLNEESFDDFPINKSRSCGNLAQFYHHRSNSTDSAVVVDTIDGYSGSSSNNIAGVGDDSPQHSVTNSDICESFGSDEKFKMNEFLRKNFGRARFISEDGVNKRHGMIASHREAAIIEDTVSSTNSRSFSKTPSVIISDHSTDTVSLHVALASEDFTLDDFRFKDSHHVSEPLSYDALMGASVCTRKVSECSTCSSISTIDMGSVHSGGFHGRLSLSGCSCLRKISGCSICSCSRKISGCSTCSFNSQADSTHESSPDELCPRRISDCSTCSSTLTASEDEIDRELSPPVLLTAKKPSNNWKKVRNVVQWTPFIQTYKRRKYPWVQLAGHQGNFKAGSKQGTILKKLCPAEKRALEILMKDVLRPYVPHYMGVIEGAESEKYLQLQDLLSDFPTPCVMDLKMGVRTYLEEELAKAREKPKLRKDMYEKMIQIDPTAPSEAEHRAKAVTKPRYMVWRETISSTANLGFRIEGVRRADGTSSKDFKTTRTREQVKNVLSNFLHTHALSTYIQRLKAIRATLEISPFFSSHELIGSSLLFVHNENNETEASVWLIDFAKTMPLPEKVKIGHRHPWVEGTHEDGYLLGLDNLIEIIQSIYDDTNNTQQSEETSADVSVSSNDTEAIKTKEIIPDTTSAIPPKEVSSDKEKDRS